MFRLRCPSIPGSTAGDVHECLPLQSIQASCEAEPQAALAVLINGIAAEAEVGALGLGLRERSEGAAVVAVHAMPRGANPDVAIPVFRDGVDLVLSQAPHKPAFLIPNATN